MKEIVVKQVGEKPLHRSAIKKNEYLPEWDIKSLENGIANGFADWYSSIHSSENDIFVLRTGGRNGLLFEGKNGIASSTFYCITPLWISSKFIFYYLKYKEFEYSDLRDLKPSFWEMEIPIPPLEEQKYIAQSIEEAYQNFSNQNQEAENSLLDSFRNLVPIQADELERIEGLDSFKRTVLDLAVSGKLTEKWREEGEIFSEYKKYFLSEITNQITDGEHLTPKKISGINNFKMLSAKNIRDGYIDFNDIDYISEKDYTNALKRCSPQINDILMVSVGATIGRCSIVVADTKFVIVRSIALIRPNIEKIISKFLFIQLKSNQLQRIIQQFSTGNAQQSLYLNKIKTIEISVPTLEEQNEIVKIVEHIFEQAEQIQNDFDLQKNQQENLLKSVIGAFFQFSTFPDSESDWDLDTLIKIARNKKEKEIKELRKKQNEFQKTLLNFGEMKLEDKKRIKNEIKEVIYKDFSAFEILTEKEISQVRETIHQSSKNFDEDDFASVFIEMTQQNFEKEEPVFFESIIKDDTLAFKFRKQ